ncbi:hypothetical protein [Streptomyces prasinus]
MNGHTEVVVTGGGHAGVMAADRPTRRDDVTVTLINPRPDFVERIRPHHLVGGSHDAVPAHRRVLAEGVRPVADSVTHIETLTSVDDAHRRGQGLGGTVEPAAADESRRAAMPLGARAAGTVPSRRRG